MYLQLAPRFAPRKDWEDTGEGVGQLSKQKSSSARRKTSRARKLASGVLKIPATEGLPGIVSLALDMILGTPLDHRPLVGTLLVAALRFQRGRSLAACKLVHSSTWYAALVNRVRCRQIVICSTILCLIMSECSLMLSIQFSNSGRQVPYYQPRLLSLWISALFKIHSTSSLHPCEHRIRSRTFSESGYPLENLEVMK